MKVLIIGGTGTISSSVSKLLMNKKDIHLYLLHRKEKEGDDNCEFIRGDINDPNIKTKLGYFDVVIDFICFDEKDAKRDIELFTNNCAQFIFISTASVYAPSNYPLTEQSKVENKFWKYSQDKIKAEVFFLNAFKEHHFPVTIVRPSHTYCDKKVPVPIHGKIGTWQIVQRILQNKPVIVHGDGETLWTFTHSDDFAKGICGLVGELGCVGETFHITSDEVLTWNESIELIAKVWNCDVTIVHIPTDILIKYDATLEGQMKSDKGVCRVFDNSKIKMVVPSFNASITLREGLERVKEYLDLHPTEKQKDVGFDEWCDLLVGKIKSI